MLFQSRLWDHDQGTKRFIMGGAAAGGPTTQNGTCETWDSPVTRRGYLGGVTAISRPMLRRRCLSLSAMVWGYTTFFRKWTRCGRQAFRIDYAVTLRVANQYGFARRTEVVELCSLRLPTDGEELCQKQELQPGESPGADPSFCGCRSGSFDGVFRRLSSIRALAAGQGVLPTTLSAAAFCRQKLPSARCMTY